MQEKGSESGAFKIIMEATRLNMLSEEECCYLIGWLSEKKECLKFRQASSKPRKSSNITVTHGGLWNERK